MSYRKYDSIENHYREAYIRKAMDNDFTLRRCTYIVQEKIHGANLGILFYSNLPPLVYSGNNKLDVSGNGFNDLGATLRSEPMASFIYTMQRYCYENDMTIRLYGEFFGPGIQKGVDYGKEKRIRFFDMMMATREAGIENMGYVSQDEFKYFMEDLGCGGFGKLIVPTVCFVDGLENALLFDAKRNSLLGPDLGFGNTDSVTNVMEGVVIKPFHDVKRDHYGRIFYIKSKNNEFLEKVKAKKRKAYSPEDPVIVELRSEFESYLTEMRMQSVFSKMGPIEEMNKMGEYIKAFSADAIEDFMKDFGERMKELSPSEQRKITGIVGKIAAPMLKAAM